MTGNVSGKSANRPFAPASSVIYLNTPDCDRNLRSYLAQDFDPDTPPRLILAAEQLRAWMKVNDSTSPDGWGS